MHNIVDQNMYNCQAFVQILNLKSSIQKFGQKADIIISGPGKGLTLSNIILVTP